MVILVYKYKTETVMVDYLLGDTFVPREPNIVDLVAVCFIGGLENSDTKKKRIDLWLVTDKLLSHKDVTNTHDTDRGG